MKVSVTKLLIAMSRLFFRRYKVQAAWNCGLVNVNEVQPLNFSMEAFTGQPLKTKSKWWW